MSERFYTAEEAAQVLGLQVRTVRTYIRDGRLPGVKIGKQYRVGRGDLEAFMGSGAETGPPQPQAAPGRAVEASCVIQVDAISVREAEAIANALAAAVAGRGPGAARLRVEPIHDPQASRLKAIVVGSAADTVEIVRMVDALAREQG